MVLLSNDGLLTSWKNKKNLTNAFEEKVKAIIPVYPNFEQRQVFDITQCSFLEWLWSSTFMQKVSKI